MNAPLQCPQCRAPLPDEFVNRPDLAPCPRCGGRVQVEIYPALFRPKAEGHAGEAVMIEGEASCFYHPEKKAVRPCDGCGRFLCSLCDCELHGEHFCPACLEVGRKKGKIRRLENERTLYDSIALALTIYPLLVFYFTLLAAPLALFIAIRYWNAPGSIIRRTKARMIAAIVLALLELSGWAVGFYFIFTQSKFHAR
jgi:hypothetical protein